MPFKKFTNYSSFSKEYINDFYKSINFNKFRDIIKLTQNKYLTQEVKL